MLTNLSVSGSGVAVNAGDRLYRPQPLPRPRLLQRGQPQRGARVRTQPPASPSSSFQTARRLQSTGTYQTKHFQMSVTRTIELKDLFTKIFIDI